jgi:two-component system, NtrC family, response regulator AtoC
MRRGGLRPPDLLNRGGARKPGQFVVLLVWSWPDYDPMTSVRPPLRVLFASPEQRSHAAVLSEMQTLGYAICWRGAADDAFAAIDGDEYDLVILHEDLPGGATSLCRQLAADRPDVRVIIALREPAFAPALAAVRAGAIDLLLEPIRVTDVAEACDRAQRHREYRLEVKRLRQVLADMKGFEDLVGASQPMQRMYAMLEQAAQTTASVLITGESGTGKEIVARTLHRRSRRKDGPFVAVNLSALPDTLLESELFGHVKGAFTDAKVARSGLFVKASGGTLLLDEIGDMPLSLQPKLLRALQERRVKPVGADVEVPFDVRVVAATNRNLEDEVVEKRFREDLFYRINVIHVAVPALRDRGTDILMLAEQYVQHFAAQLEKDVRGVSYAAAEKLLAYDWPGNVRELQNCIERAVALTQHDEVQLGDLPEKLRKYRRSHVLVVSNTPSELVSMDEVERRYVLRVLKAVKGNKKEAARVLGFDRKTLYRKLDRYGLASDRNSKLS